MSKNHILALMCGVVVMTVIDLAIVNTALPSIQTDLGADPADLQWVVVIYGIFVAGFLLLGGRMGDLAGHRSVLIAGVAILAAASLVGGLAGSLEVLIVARAAQGLGAALAAPNALAILSQHVRGRAGAQPGDGDLRRRGRRGGGVQLGAGRAARPGSRLAVGVLHQRADRHRAGACSSRACPPTRRARQRARTDATGAIALTAGLMAVAFGVHETIEHGWLAWQTLLPLLGGLALLGGIRLARGTRAHPADPAGDAAQAVAACGRTSPRACCGRASSA